MAAQNVTMQQTLKDVMAETKEDRELAKKAQAATADVVKQLLTGQAEAIERNHVTQPHVNNAVRQNMQMGMLMMQSHTSGAEQQVMMIQARGLASPPNKTGN
jgi:hypothetical protein